MVLRVAIATHGDVERLLHRPYYRTLWTYLHLVELERMDALKERGRQIATAGLLAIAFHDPKRLADEHHQWLDALGALPSAEEARTNAADVIEAMRRIDAGEITTTVVTPSAPGSVDG